MRYGVLLLNSGIAPAPVLSGLGIPNTIQRLNFQIFSSSGTYTPHTGTVYAIIEWVGDRDAKTAWAECKRGDWMLWLVNKSNPKMTLALRKKLVKCACYPVSALNHIFYARPLRFLVRVLPKN